MPDLTDGYCMYDIQKFKFGVKPVSCMWHGVKYNTHFTHINNKKTFFNNTRQIAVSSMF